MSATNRGLRERLVDDAYMTPKWVTHAILSAVNSFGLWAIPRQSGLWLEPCAGKGAIIEAVNESGQASPSWIAVEKRAACRRALSKIALLDLVIMDFLRWNPDVGTTLPNVLLTNPPFSLAMDFIEHAQKILPTTLLVFLLRLNFLESQKRARFFRDYMPDVYVLPKRPSFTGTGTDATGYAWMIWRPASEGRRPVGSVTVLDLPDLG